MAGLGARLRRAWKLVRGRTAGDKAKADPPKGDAAPLPGWMRVLAPNVQIEAHRIAVDGRTASGTRSVLRNLSLELTGARDHSFHATGSGDPGAHGRLLWDLHLEPLEVRGEGTVSFAHVPIALIAPLFSSVPLASSDRSFLDGDLRVHSVSKSQLALRGRVEVHDAVLFSPRIAPHAIRGISFSLEGHGSWEPLARRLRIAHGRVTMGAAHVDVVGALERPVDHYRIDLTATLPPTACSDAVSAIPRDLLDDVAGFSFQGSIGGRLEAHVDSRDLNGTRLAIRIADGCQFVTVPAMADLRRVEGPFLYSVAEPDGTVFQMTTGPGTSAWTAIADISPFLVHAVLAHEDAAFFGHHGFAPWAIRDALVRDLTEGRYVLGASTITMQLAKNLFLDRQKTLGRKVQEVILTWWLENALRKADILELYLNLIEYGPSVYGIRQAAEHYFGREPADLSAAESAFIACILPNPKLYGAQYARGKIPRSLAGRMRSLLRHMEARGRIDQAALSAALAEVDAFHFHHDGDPPPPPHALVGSYAPLPLGLDGSSIDAWDSWDDEGADTFNDSGEPTTARPRPTVPACPTRPCPCDWVPRRPRDRAPERPASDRAGARRRAPCGSRRHRPPKRRREWRRRLRASCRGLW